MNSQIAKILLETDISAPSVLRITGIIQSFNILQIEYHHKVLDRFLKPAMIGISGESIDINKSIS